MSWDFDTLEQYIALYKFLQVLFLRCNIGLDSKLTEISGKELKGAWSLLVQSTNEGFHSFLPLLAAFCSSSVSCRLIALSIDSCTAICKTTYSLKHVPKSHPCCWKNILDQQYQTEQINLKQMSELITALTDSSWEKIHTHTSFKGINGG